MGFKEWIAKMKKEDPARLKEYWRKNKAKQRAKKKVIKKQKEVEESQRQFKLGNLNWGIHFRAPKPLSWEEWKLKNPQGDFWDYMDYKTSLRKPEIEKLIAVDQKKLSHREKMNRRMRMKEEGGNLPDTVQQGFNFFHPEQEKTDLQVIEEKEKYIRDIITKHEQESQTINQKQSISILEQIKRAVKRRNYESENEDYTNKELPPETPIEDNE